MNDAYRGGVIVVALVAFYLAARLSGAHLLHWRKATRRHITLHVFWLSFALAATTGIVVSSLLKETGRNAPLTWQDWLRLPQVAAIAAGLRPLWAHHNRLRETTNG